MLLNQFLSEGERIMEVKIFNDYGVLILKRDNKYFVRVDSGELASRLIEAEISKEDVSRIKQDESLALKVLINYQNKGAFYNV